MPQLRGNEPILGLNKNYPPLLHMFPYVASISFIYFIFFMHNVYVLHSRARDHTLYLHYIIKLGIKMGILYEWVGKHH
jgi:hypothetical protein